MLRNLFVFDIETVPDTEACRNLIDTDSTDINELREELVQYHLKITDGKNDFLRQPFHRVVAISFLSAEIIKQDRYQFFRIKEVRSGGTVHSNEEDLLKGFFQYISLNQPRLVSFNGRIFDLPVLKYRAMIYNIQGGYIYTGGTSKWDNYTYRYNLDWHCDLLDALSDFGMSARVRMNEVCAAFGLPGKFAMDGTQVAELYDAGRMEDIRNYCETDVLNTYLIYLRFMHHYNHLTTAMYNDNIEELHEYLQSKTQKHSHIKKFINTWKKKSST